MRIELHLLQNFAPANLNRDESGAPKDCEFGGYRRARISSQCLKRSVRLAMTGGGMLPSSTSPAVRTKRLVGMVADALVKSHGTSPEDAALLAQAVLAAAEFKSSARTPGDELKTEYLLFVPERVATGLASLAALHADAIRGVAAGAAPAASDGKGPKKTSKKDAAGALPKELRDGVTALLGPATRCPEIALFGRMLADHPNWNVDAACQVAHAISTNRVVMDFDYYTAVDDRRPGDNQGSDMIGTVQFNSSCFYRFSTLDVGLLRENLGAGAADATLVGDSVAAWLRASVVAIPTGKQNSMAAHNPPGFVLVVVRDGTSWSLANAFLDPVRARPGEDLVAASASQLDAHLRSLVRMYGATDLRHVLWMAADGIEQLPGLAGAETAAFAPAQVRRVQPLGELVASVRELVAR